MADKTVENFIHHVGVHCGSVALTNLLRHQGIEISEAMTFGLGSGLGFTYVVNDHFNPSRIIMGRHWYIEEFAADVLGMKLLAHRTDDPIKGWDDIKHAIDQGYPVMVQCDLRYLPYWQTNTSFNGHRIVVVGYNDDSQEALIADTHFEGIQRISYEQLAASRASTALPSLNNEHAWWLLERSTPRDFSEAIPEALVKNARDMIHNISGIGGLEAMEKYASEAHLWREAPDAVWAYRFAYQCIEKRGTGGAMFRNLYRDYLYEAEAVIPGLVREQLAVSMTRTAQSWQTFARYLLAMSQYLDPDDSSIVDDPSYHLETMAEAVYQFECTFWDRIEMISESL